MTQTRVITAATAALVAVLLSPNVTFAGPLRLDYLLQADSATPGVLGGFALSTDLAPTTISGTDADGNFSSTTARAESGELGLSGVADGQALVVSSLTFQDTLTIFSTTLAFGTPVELAIGFDVDYTMTPSQCPPSPTGITSQSWLDAGLSVGLTDLTFGAGGCTPNPDNRSGTVSTFVGDQLDLVAWLSVTAAAGNCCSDGYAEVNALNMMAFFAQPLGSDFSYMTLSGDLYLPEVTAVPEPSTLFLLMGGGIVAFARLQRNGRHK